jgi:ribosomal protein S28E/S33
MIVVASTTRPGELSIRAKQGDATATAIFRALNVSGAKVGDVLELRQVPRKAARTTEPRP